MFQTHTLFADIRRTLLLAVPLIGAQLLQMGNGLVDALVAGRLGRAELAAGGIAAGLWFFVSLACIGLTAGLSPTLSKMIGERRRDSVGVVFRQGLWLGALIGVLALLVLLLVAAKLPVLSLEAELVPLIRQYLISACWSLPAFAVVLVSRNVCEATGLVRPVLVVQMIGLLVNIVADLALGLGWFGFPRLGLFGIGLTTSLVMLCMAIALLLLLRGQRFTRYNLFAGIEYPDWQLLKPVLVLSLPIFLGLVFEAGLFVATAVQMGKLGTLEAAAHYIAMGATSFCFMLPLGLSFALTARVGRVLGRDQMAALKLRVLSGLIISAIMALATALLLLLFRHSITELYTNDVDVRLFAAQLLLMAALFQFSDAFQVSLTGMLRGMHDTRVPMFINAFSYWVIAFGMGYYAAHYLGFGAMGFWAGLVIGLSLAALLLAWRLRVMLQKLAGTELALAR